MRARACQGQLFVNALEERTFEALQAEFENIPQLCALLLEAHSPTAVSSSFA
jgi:hypothetical protein